MHEFSDRLFTPAVEVITLHASHTVSQGWRLWVAHRHSGEPWETCGREVYGPLSTDELVAAVDGVLDSLL